MSKRYKSKSSFCMYLTWGRFTVTNPQYAPLHYPFNINFGKCRLLSATKIHYYTVLIASLSTAAKPTVPRRKLLKK